MRNEPKLRAILFDVDGTLIDTVHLIVRALDYTYRKHLGIALPHEEIRRLIGLPLHVQMHYLDDKLSHPVDHAQMEQDERAYYEAHRHQERVIPEMLEAVRCAKQRGYRTALVTSKNQREYAVSRPQLQLDDWIDAIVTADDTECHKPHPDPVFKALERLEVAPESAIYIGDTVYDITCGRSAGTLVASVAWGAHLPEDLRAAQPDYFFEQPNDALEWIQSLPRIDEDGTTQEDSFRVHTLPLFRGSYQK